MTIRDDLVKAAIDWMTDGRTEYQFADDLLAAGWRPTTDVEYAVKHPVNGEPRLAREPLDDCRRYAEQFETTILHRHVGPWTDGEPA